MEELTVFSKLQEIDSPQQIAILGGDREQMRRIAEHRAWMRSIRKERPDTETAYRIGVYIRYFNQTKYENYLYYHKKQFADTIALCPKWTLFDFYIDEGSSTPSMEHAPEWSRLLEDCMADKIDLILTQKISNVTKHPDEIALLSRLLAAKKHPTGIYFISEDIFTLASYYQEDLRDTFFLPDTDKRKSLPGEEKEGIAP